jgi:hypothetical protein
MYDALISTQIKQRAKYLRKGNIKMCVFWVLIKFHLFLLK